MRQRQKVSRAGIELIERFEGLRRKAARLPGGGWTIGYGHTRSAREGAEVSHDDAEALLHFDLLGVVEAVNELVFTPLSQNQFDALAAFAFNVGVEAFRQSDVLRRVNEGRLTEAACALDLWRKAEVAGDPIVLDALIRRRAAEKALFLTPEGGFVATPSPLVRPSVDLAAPEVMPTSRPVEVEVPMDGDTAEVRRVPEVEPQPEPEPAPAPQAVIEAAPEAAPVVVPMPEPEPDPVAAAHEHEIEALESSEPGAEALEAPQDEMSPTLAAVSYFADAGEAPAEPAPEPELETEVLAEAPPHWISPPTPTPAAPPEPELEPIAVEPESEPMPEPAVEPAAEPEPEPVAETAPAPETAEHPVSVAEPTLEAAPAPEANPEPEPAPAAPPANPSWRQPVLAESHAMPRLLANYGPMGGAAFGLSPSAPTAAPPAPAAFGPPAVANAETLSELTGPEALSPDTPLPAEALVLTPPPEDWEPPRAPVFEPSFPSPEPHTDQASLFEEAYDPQPTRIVRHETFEPETEPGRPLAGSAIYVLLGATGFTSFAGAVAAFIRGRAGGPGSHEMTWLAWTLVIIGAGCVAMSVYNLLKRLDGPEA